MSGERKTFLRALEGKKKKKGCIYRRATWVANDLLCLLAWGALWLGGPFLLLHKCGNILWMKSHLLNPTVLKTSPLQTNPKLSCFRATMNFPAATLKHTMETSDCKASSSGPSTQTSISATGKPNATTTQKSRAQREIPDKNRDIDRRRKQQAAPDVEKWQSHSEPTGRHPASYHSDPVESLSPLPWLLLSNRSLHQ